MPAFLVCVAPREPSADGESIHALYLLEGPTLSASAVAQLAAMLLHDPVVQVATWRPLERAALADEQLPAAGSVVELAYRPGVTDNEGESVLEGARRLGVAGLSQARALRRYLLPAGVEPGPRAAALAIELVQTTSVYRPGEPADARLSFYRALLAAPSESAPRVASVALREASDDELLRLSRVGVLALDLAEMQALRDYFASLGRDPSDGELETVAQTWSEHCSHKSFKARVRYREQRTGNTHQPDPGHYPMLARLEAGETEIDSLLKTFLMAATDKVLASRGASCASDNWVLSAFVDNAGIIAFGEQHEVSFKVETHNHPSALEPFGGANTGVGGVIRDLLGVSAEPIANTDVLCFGPPDAALAAQQAGVLDPRRIAAGVVAGVRDYGNKLGIPTVNGAVLFDEGYLANPLVYCGTLGIAPRGAHPHRLRPGDAVVVLGGRTGRDGIHGATFSSVELTHETAATVGSAVQIGDPITEKKLLDVLLQARDRQLYAAITDCGAGGLSSAVGEMGAETGVAVELSLVPRKYAGLQPWEVWISEAQERMVLAVPPAQLDAFLALCAEEDVEATAIGQFTDDGRLHVTHGGETVVDLTMAFLHDGRPQRELEAVWAPRGQQGERVGEQQGERVGEQGASTLVPSYPPTLLPSYPPTLLPSYPPTLLPSYAPTLLQLLAHPNIASKERIVRSYDHEVRGATVIKPLVGPHLDGPGDAAVLQPLARSPQGLAVGCGINPRYGRLDPYWMALAAVDEALRNVVAVGGDPSRTAILDNFCWGDPRRPDRLGGLVRAAAGCYDAAVAFGTPFISGKDSLNNEYRNANGERVAIPPTLLISALAHVPDVRQCVTMDLKQQNNWLYLIGATRRELAGSHLSAVSERDRYWDYFANTELPRVDLEAAPRSFAALHQAIRAGLVRACHDLSEGGLAVAAAEMVIAGGLGLELDLAALGLPDDPLTALFSETPSRFLVEVRPEDAQAFEAALAGVALACVGRVTADDLLHIQLGGEQSERLPLEQLRQAWKSGLDNLEF